MNSPLEILFIHKKPALQKSLEDILKENGVTIEWTSSESTEEALKIIYQKPFDLVLFDLLSAASLNLTNFLRFSTEIVSIPIVTLVPKAHSNLGEESVLAGAQDWIAYESLYAELIMRVFSYAQERHQLKEALRGMSLIDSVTGLYNKVGFEAIIHPQLQMVRRQKRPTLFFSLDIVNLDEIVERQGPTERQTALLRVGQILWKSFRRSDIIGRMGTEEFSVFAPDATMEHSDLIVERIKNNLREQEQSENWGYTIKTKIGYTELDVDSNSSIDELIRRARILGY